MQFIMFILIDAYLHLLICGCEWLAFGNRQQLVEMDRMLILHVNTRTNASNLL